MKCYWNNEESDEKRNWKMKWTLLFRIRGSIDTGLKSKATRDSPNARAVENPEPNTHQELEKLEAGSNRFSLNPEASPLHSPEYIMVLYSSYPPE